MNTKTIEKLRQVYWEGAEPPSWILTFHFTPRDLKSVICYYDKGANLQDVKDLVHYREPVNIAMNRLYNQSLLQKYFGYTKSVYNENSPNIAIYCRTPFNKFKFVNVLNVIGVAIDSTKQPDYRRILAKGPIEYVNMVCAVFKKIRHCFYTKPLTYLVLHGFGLGAFSSLQDQLDIDAHQIFTLCFNMTFENLPPNKKIVLNKLSIETTIPVQKINIPVQKLIMQANQSLLNDSLYINAWDCFSIIGNGNGLDASLDGYFGRSSAMSVLGWDVTNPCIRYEAVA